MVDPVEGERQLRRLLWALSALQPGDPKAEAVLQELQLREVWMTSISPVDISSASSIRRLILQGGRSLMS